MENNNYSEFCCNSSECYLENENYYSNNFRKKDCDCSCSYCAFDKDNISKLRNKIYEEIMINKKMRCNQLRAKLFEYIIAIVAGTLVVGYILYFLAKIYFPTVIR